MTNDEMWRIIKCRIEHFHKRIFKPFGLSEDDDIEYVEKLLKRFFHKSRCHKKWMITFLNKIECVETEIVQNKTAPKSFKVEISSLLNFVSYGFYYPPGIK